MLPSGKKGIFSKPLNLTTRNMSNNEVRKATISGPPYAKQGKNLISVYVLLQCDKINKWRGI